MSSKNVTVIPARQFAFVQGQPTSMAKRKVAGYARVSTDQDEQQNSYEAQVSFYTSYIQSKPEWEFVEVYTDEGISGTSTKHREGFKRMIADALAGKIDLILTKSVSRFARNTVDSLTTIRQLREKGVEVFFEKENIYTLDSKGELLLTIMSSIAQEESRSISKNVAWGKRKAMADGKVYFAYSSFLGYGKDKDGKIYIIEEQAKVVRRIYDEFLAGASPNVIAKRLTADGVPTPMDKTKWQDTTVRSILQNVKYRGDSVLQDTFIEDFLTKKVKKNNGELPKYYVRENHPPIIPPPKFEMVQEEFRRRRAGGSFTSISPFSGRIVCGDCGGFYGRKVWHSNTPYRSYEWHCNNKFQERRHCTTPTVKEKAIEKCFVDAFNKVLSRKEEITENYALCLDAITDVTELNARKAELGERIQEESKRTSDFLYRMSGRNDDLDGVNEKYNAFVAGIARLQDEENEVVSQISLLAAKRLNIDAFLDVLSEHDTPLTEFDPFLWQAVVNHMVIYHDMTVKFVLRDGSEISGTIERGVREYARRNKDSAGED